MRRRFSLQIVEKAPTLWRCAGCQVPHRSATQPTAKNRGTGCHKSKLCGVWLSSEVVTDQRPRQSQVRAVIEACVATGWGRGRMSSACEPQIRAAVSAALQAEFKRDYIGHIITFEHERDSALFEVNMRGQLDPILYRFPWPDWSPDK